MEPKSFNDYAAEINKLAVNHTDALLALYSNAFNDGMRIGKRNVLLGMSVGVVVGVIGLCVAGITYLEHKEQS